MSVVSLSIVLPCFNEEGNIARVVDDFATWMRDAGIGGEIIAVDDGSSDATFKILMDLTKKFPMLRVLRHDRNQGYGIAVRTGCDVAKEDIIAYVDSDGQFRAHDLELLLPLLETCDFVTGRRSKRADSLIRNLFGKILGGMNVLILGLWVRDVNCGMKIFRRSIWPQIRPQYAVEKLYNTEVYLSLKRSHIPWKQLNVPHYPRTAGSSTGADISVILRMFREWWDLRRRR